MFDQEDQQCIDGRKGEGVWLLDYQKEFELEHALYGVLHISITLLHCPAWVCV